MYKQFSFRTDLADEEVGRINEELFGIKEEIKKDGDIEIKKIKINKKHDERIKKKPGVYYTIDLKALNIHDNDSAEKIISVFSKVLTDLLKYKKVLDKQGMIVGLGNINITPDSIGPNTIDNLIITRHLFLNDIEHSGYSNISAYSPGVMGNTGIETKDIVESIKNKVNPDYLIVIDALATSKLERINKSIQITDTGISPGSGVGNKRKEISYESLNIPVIAVGIPTVVDANTLTLDIIDQVANYARIKENQKLIKAINGLKEESFFEALNKSTINTLYEMMVTPKEIDEVVEDLGKILAAGIDIAVHKKLREVYLK